ncbi:hypothetical protein BDD12DRAFT_873078 [Trichophaea hybrida]|nr:hypothetical protein BDD12DRAFT_873078 [Trichophaea hybrida]
MKIRRRIFLAVGIWVQARLLQAQRDGPNEVNDFCAISGASVAIANEKAYLFGGFSFWEGFPDNYTGPNNFLRIIDFSKPFRSGDDVSKYVVNEALPSIVPRGTFSELWPTEKNTLDLFHGFHEPSPIEIARNDSAATVIYPLTAKHRYSISGKEWTSTNVKSADLEMAKLGKENDGALQKFATRMSAWIPGINRGYALGGELYWDSPKKSWKDIRHVGDHHGLLVYDLATDSWKNETMPIKSIRMGVLVHLKTEDDDILITFGGMTDEAIGSTRRLRGMREFSIYSTKRSKWYSYVSPEGSAIPDPRSDMCWAVVSAQDNSSHQIIMYGGRSTNDLEIDGSVWVLSIPSFDWVRLPGNSTDSSREPGKRVNPTCVLVGNKYMLSWGGRRYLKNGGNLQCDKYGNAVFLLDINKGDWVDQYEVGQHYLVPEAVVKVIGGSGKGGAKKLVPDGGFGDLELEKLMKFKIEESPDISTLSPTVQSSKPRTGIIIGAVVGGIAIVAALGASFFIFRRRKHQLQANTPPPAVVELHNETAKIHEAHDASTVNILAASPVFGELQGDVPTAHVQQQVRVHVDPER